MQSAIKLQSNRPMEARMSNLGFKHSTEVRNQSGRLLPKGSQVFQETKHAAALSSFVVCMALYASTPLAIRKLATQACHSCCIRRQVT